MLVVQRPLFLLVLAILLTSICHSNTAAQKISPIAAVRGVTPRGCQLTNLSTGARPNDPVCPDWPTYVITHGYNPAPNLFRLTNPQAYAAKIRDCHPGPVNVLAYHWDSRGQGSRHGNTNNAINAGTTLANELLQRGIIPERTTMIGHSMGAVVVSSAANCMFIESGSCTKKLVLLDGPKRRLTTIMEDLQATRCATEVENFWASGLTGLGNHIHNPLVKNIRAPVRRPHWHKRGPLSPARNNHVDILLWYYETQL